jgi:transcription-repair coupling factor (superfamily II helicase)
MNLMTQTQHWHGIHSLAQSHTIAEQFKLDPKQLMVVVANDNIEAEQLLAELNLFLNNESFVAIFPDWEVLPYDSFSPSEEIVSERIKLLANLHTSRGIIILSISTLLQRLPPKPFITGNHFSLSVGDTLQTDETSRQLEAQGYRHVKEVIAHGEFTLRGSIIDLYPSGSTLPFRIDLFDNEVESIRTFSTETQRSIAPVNAINIFTAKEFPFDESAIKTFKHQWRVQMDGNPDHHTAYQYVKDGLLFNGIEFFLPLFFEETDTFFDYVPTESTIIFKNSVAENIHLAWQNIQTHYEQKRHDTQYPLLEPKQLWITEEEFYQKTSDINQVKLFKKTHDKHLSINTQSLPELSVDYKKQDPFAKLKTFTSHYKGAILLCTETQGRREIVNEILRKHQINTECHADFPNGKLLTGIIHLISAPIERSLILEEKQLCILSESDLFTQQVNQRRSSKQRKLTDNELSVKSLVELCINEPIVHLEHGVGKYLGLKKIAINNSETEYLTIEYAGKDKLYVPVTSLHLIGKFTAVNKDTVRVNKLGTERWGKSKKKAYEKARDVAAELLEIYARREATKGVRFSLPKEQYDAFSESFPFEETVDQARCIKQVIEDLTKTKAMDRVVCGDVGFGKTEVAMRATFITVLNGYQTIILVPTTLLAEQHGHNFKDRFANWPVQVEVLSRFKTAKEQEAILEKLQDGKLDIIIGTHKLLQKGIAFKNPGLMIIDEEHRFGVKQKEQLKKLKANVNILTMTATPIPRTLNFALSAIRDFSIIASPPEKRLAIKTFIHENRSHIVLEAIQRELHRGGQIYYVHNNVSTLNMIANDLQKLVPEMKMQIAHGQMRERELERIMADFYHRRFSLLLCTTIIETGIDVPTANTIIINRADKFGLAQLHQLRGRVGRSHHQAYAYLLAPERKALTSDAKKRLDAIASLGDLGSGLALATHDLEIRGAGELLGDEQSGQMQEIGFTLYMEILDQAVKDIRAGKLNTELNFSKHTEIELNLPAILPDDYIPDVNLRLQLYKRISSATSDSDLDNLQVEMIDRFGLLPTEAKHLFDMTSLRLLAEKMGIEKITGGSIHFKLTIKEENNIPIEKIISLIQKRPDAYKLLSPSVLQVANKEGDPSERSDLLRKVLAVLAS